MDRDEAQKQMNAIMAKEQATRAKLATAIRNPDYNRRSIHRLELSLSKRAEAVNNLHQQHRALFGDDVASQILKASYPFDSD